LEKRKAVVIKRVLWYHKEKHSSHLMTHTNSRSRITPFARWTARLSAGVMAMSVRVIHAYAAVFQGGGLNGGVDHAKDLKGISQNSDVRAVVLAVVKAVLNFLALAAVVVIIIAGVLLIFSVGNEEAMGKAKKTIQYTLIGLAIVLFARVIVGFITTYIASQVG
jgi:hypothetical protein